MKNPIFRTLYFVYLGLIIMAAFIILALLWKKLVVFQNDEDRKMLAEERLTRLEQAPQRCFSDFLEGFDAAALSKEWLKDNPDTLETYDTCLEYFTDLLNSSEEGFVCYKADSYTDEAPVFLVELSGEDVAEVSLFGRGISWEIDDISMFVKGNETMSVFVPDGYSVSVNGSELGKKYIKTADIIMFPYDSEREEGKYDEVLTGEIKWNYYFADGFLKAPTVTVTDRKRSALSDEELMEAVRMPGEGEDIYVDGFLKVYADEEISASLQEKASKFLESYLIYYTYGKNHIDDHLADAQSYCTSGSPADKALIKAYEDSVGWAYGYVDPRCELLGLGRPVMWADNCCSVDIAYHAYAKRGGEEQDYSRKDEMIRIVLLDQGKGYKVYAFDVTPKGSYL